MAKVLTERWVLDCAMFGLQIEQNKCFCNLLTNSVDRDIMVYGYIPSNKPR